MTKKQAIVMSILTIIMISSFIALNIEDILNDPVITGMATTNTRLVIITLGGAECNITLENGWNLVSFPCLSDPIDIDLLFKSNSSYGHVMAYSPITPNDPWKSYNPSLPSWVIQDLDQIERNYGYWVLTSATTEFYLNNTLATPTLTDLEKGWNLVGYPSRDVQNTSSVFKALEPGYDYVLMYNASDPSDKWKEYTWNSSLPSNQDFNYSVPNYGIWIYMLNTDSLVIT